MKAQLKNGKIVTGKAADVFIRIGIAEEIIDDEANFVDDKPVVRKSVKKKKKRGRPKK